MPNWNKDYYITLAERFAAITDGLDDRLEDIIKGKVVPAVENIDIGSAKSVRAAVIFFDICNFSGRTGSIQLSEMKKALLMLDCVIPMIMNVVYDYGGYIEKNTGDGVMAIIGIEKNDEEATTAALNVATDCFYILDNLINPFFSKLGISPVALTVGIDLGPLLLARIGVHTGTSKINRNFLTAVGPAANLACKLQGMAGVNEIWTGDLIYSKSASFEKQYFMDVTPQNWTWVYMPEGLSPYRIWYYHARRVSPFSLVSS